MTATGGQARERSFRTSAMSGQPTVGGLAVAIHGIGWSAVNVWRASSFPWSRLSGRRTLTRGVVRMLPAVLPRLRGVGLGLFRLAFALVFALAVFSAAAATWFEARETEMTTAEFWSGAVYGLGVRIFPPVAAKGWPVPEPHSSEAV